MTRYTWPRFRAKIFKCPVPPVFAFWRFRKQAAALRVLVLIAMLAGTTFLMTGCGGFSLNSAKPGNYVLQVTATGEQTGVTHVANLTLTVTQ